MSDGRPLPERGPDLAEWLGERVGAFDLAETVEAMRAGRPAPPAATPAVGTILGADAAALLADGFRALPESRLIELRSHLTRHPDLLFDLQELIFLHGGPAWNARLAAPTGGPPPVLSALSDRAVDRVLSRITAPPGMRDDAAADGVSPAAGVAPASPSDPPRRKRERVLATAGVCLGCALLAAIGVGIASDAARTADADRWADRDHARLTEIARLKDDADGWVKKDRDRAAEITRLKEQLALATPASKDEPPNPKFNATLVSASHGADFNSGPYKVPDVVTGCDIQTDKGGVKAWISNAPTYRIQYIAGKHNLTVQFAGTGDTTLLIYTPDGKWVADNDSDGTLNPRITFNEPKSGKYAIWVGTVLKKEEKGTLIITEEPR